MRILYLNHYAGSPELGMEYRPYYLAREWRKAGHEVTIVAASFAHTRTRNPQVQAALTRETIDGVPYVWLRTPPYKGNGLARVRNMAAFVLRLYRHLGTITRDFRPDVVVCSSTYPLDYYPARWIARRVGARVVFEVHDLWPLSPMELGRMSPRHPFIRVMQRAEDAWCRGCDLAVSILPDADRHLTRHGLLPDRFVHVPNGIDLGEWAGGSRPLPAPHRAYLDRQRASGRFLVGYAGAHGVSNSLDPLIEAAALLRDEPVDFVLVGEGPERERLAAKARDLPAVTFLERLPKAAIPAWLEAMDALYLGFQHSPLYQFGVSPNKLFDYLMSGRPVVHANAASNDAVRDADAGVSVEAENPRAIADGILALARSAPEARAAMGRRGRDYILARHTYPVLAARFLDALSHGASHA